MPKAGALLNATRDEAVEHLVGRTSVDLQGRPVRPPASFTSRMRELFAD